MPPRAEIVVPGPAAPQELEAIRAAVEAAGFSPGEPTPTRQRADAVVAVMIALPLSELVKAAAGAAGKDAYAGVKRLVSRLLDARARPTGSVVLKDATGGPTLELSARVPDDAYAALGDLDFDSLGDGDLIWNPELARWELVD